MTLTQYQQQFFGRASRTAISLCIGDLQNWWDDNSWLSSLNRYRKNCIQRLLDDTKPGRRLTHSHLREYVAASVVLHCFDGWSFLGRALQAELAGDSDSARHLGYYAELRAAMSLLASEGIGVFDHKHAIVNNKSRCETFAGKDSSTHKFVWNALQYWASTPQGVRTAFQAIRPGGIVLQDWLTHFSAGANFIASEWLIQWGIDLKRLIEDREARNVASYRPTAFTSPGPNVITDTLDMTMRLWEMCEPGGGSPFSRLDRHLLRLSLELAFKNAFGRTHRQARRMYRQQVTILLQNVNPRDLSKERWKTFLTNTELEPTTPVIADAAGRDGPEHKDHSKQVLARAFLLLRVASGAAQEHLEFAVPVSRSLWPTGEPPMSFADLWADVKDAIDTLKLWLADGNAIPSHFTLWRDHAVAAGVLGTPERVALWGLGL